ncbi:hypothetical protein KSD_59190 [Ktedonobacter sp. SOSP1-85]|nr:hypothetical protein KSD_59190 [Ktedonobacter sp. SOSP1-85]
MVSFLGVKGYRIYHPKFGERRQPASNEFDRVNLLLPEVMIENFDDDLAKAMRPIFDAVWNAAGYSCSPNYDISGKFTLGS